MKKIILGIIFVLNGVVFFYACKKEAELPEQKEYDTNTSQDNQLAESTFNDVDNIGNEAIDNGSAGLSTYRHAAPGYSMLSSCATVTVIPDSSGSGGNITVDFGSQNCLCTDFRYRRGIINIAYTGPYRDSGSVITTTFTDFFVGLDTTNRMFQVTGTKTVTNNGHNASGNLNFSISVNGHLINMANVTMDWTSTRNREWTAGESTPFNWFDDEYSITGSASGTNFEGNSFTVNITSALLVKIGCPYITKGIFELTPSGKPTRTLNYGNGTCDALAVVTVNGVDYNITMR